MDHLLPHDAHRIGPYHLLSRLSAAGDPGRGVHLARSDDGRTVAVTLVPRELARHEEFRIPFRREVAASRGLSSKWTVPVLDADTEAETPWLATAYVAAPSLRQVVAHDFGPLPGRSLRALAAGLAYALQDIHAAGLVHRSLKPSRVLVTPDGPRVIDSGIARARAEADLPEPGGSPAPTGRLIGTPAFMAPELVRGEPPTPACDVFGLGAVLAYAATGAPPFGDADDWRGISRLLHRIAYEEPVLDGVPADLRDLVRDCLRKTPAERPTPAQILARTGADPTMTAA
ncbi:serine/threonine-protein kinase, partial [Streptomyces sp. WAC06614]|uniref:serine/threonine-protein kinase n=1 Tax=Streptomyces sp. WAC06614 TaxID=2487416 RepID=UPI000FC10E15